MKKIILIQIAIIAIAAGCQKYEEGPCISLRSAEKRIFGYHTLTKYTVDGADSLNQYYDSLGLKFNFIYDDVSYVNTCIMDEARRDGFSGNLYWWWELSSNKEKLIIKRTNGSSIGVGPFGINKTPEWEILKLKFSQLILSTSYNQKEYVIELTRI